VAAYGLPIDEMARWRPASGCFRSNCPTAASTTASKKPVTRWRSTTSAPRSPGVVERKGRAAGLNCTRSGSPVFIPMSAADTPTTRWRTSRLYWIIKQAEAAGLKFKTATHVDPDDNADPDMVQVQKWRRDKDGRLYDSRNGLGGYYRYGPRKIADLNHMKLSRRPGDEVFIKTPKIHVTALNRAMGGAHRYAPIGIPKHYDVLTDGGFVDQTTVGERCRRRSPLSKAGGHLERGLAPPHHLFRHRAGIDVSGDLSAGSVPRRPKTNSAAGSASSRRPFGLLGQMLPGFATPWIDAYARAPGQFLFAAALVALLIWAGSRLGSVIESRMELVWRPEQRMKRPLRPRSGLPRIAAAIGLYLLVYSMLPHWLQLPQPAHGWISHYITLTVRPDAGACPAVDAAAGTSCFICAARRPTGLLSATSNCDNLAGLPSR